MGAEAERGGMSGSDGSGSKDNDDEEEVDGDAASSPLTV